MPSALLFGYVTYQHVTEDILKERYTAQLSSYYQVVHKQNPDSNIRVQIYSFWLDDYIEIPIND